MENVITLPADGTQQTVVSTEASPREQIVRKYEQTYGTPEPVVKQEQTVVSTETPGPSFAEQMAAFKAELLAELKPKPVESVTTQEEQANWLKLLADGKQAEAEIALSKIVAKNSNFSSIKSDAVREALEAFTVQQEVANYVSQVRSKPENAEALRLEKYITSAVQARMAEAQAAGKLSTPADYVKVYKASVDTEVEEARKLALTLRGEGRQEGLTRTSQVLSAPNLQPNKIDATRQQQAPAEDVPETYQDYMASRANLARTRHRL